MNAILENWEAIAAVAMVIFFAGGVYANLRVLANGRHFVRNERFEEFSGKIELLLQSIERRTERIENWIDKQR